MKRQGRTTMHAICRYGHETQEQMLQAIRQKGAAQLKKWERGFLGAACSMVLFVLVKEICFRGRDPGNWFWFLEAAVVFPPLLYFGSLHAGHYLGYGRPTSFDREVIDLLIVREEDTMAIWQAAYGYLNSASHLVFREHVVQELSAGRALPDSDGEWSELFHRELFAARRKARMPKGYLRLVAGYLRAHGKEERLNEIARDYFPPNPRDRVACAVRAALFSEEDASIEIDKESSL